MKIKHTCSGGGHFGFHHYTVTESVKLIINKDGSQSWYIVYTYTCICEKDDRIFSKEIVDNNLIVDENTKLPTIIVSDGYVLSGGDEVVVYVHLINNPGINAANFGIRYSTKLQLIGIQNGTVPKGSLVTDGFAVNYGYNFVWANDSIFTNDGNLLKLTFRVSEYAEVGHVFNVSLIYAIGNGAQGGFGTSYGKKYFITKNGIIKVVNRLPGDVNNDGVVDLLDVATVENAFKKEYNVAFICDYSKYYYPNEFGVLSYRLMYWEGSNSVRYDTLDEAINDLIYKHYGSITLKAVWSKSPALNYPAWRINGYEDTIWYIGEVVKT